MNDDTNSFNQELMKMLLEEQINDEQTCLISGSLLEDNHIKLECNHKFNYKHIYNEVHKQKTQPWHSEVNKVRNNQLNALIVEIFKLGYYPIKTIILKLNMSIGPRL